ncbi:hypothetical protein TRIUR3_21140 [Triticum urartu]|uniref:FPL domain-containing protein n=1 Tax=Triticum urartu TaxID=4572 RepID=M7YLV3_TRIUA|nr:hypothetical protein TRIUR3_21140 [Triticum urartu]
MWLFWRTRNRFSIEELRYLTDQLQKIHVVYEANKEFVVEALRSIAELMIYGDQHDPLFFEFFMEKQIMGEFARILRISKLSRVSLQLLQTMSIMIQNLRNEHSICLLRKRSPHFNPELVTRFMIQPPTSTPVIPHLKLTTQFRKQPSPRFLLTGAVLTVLTAESALPISSLHAGPNIIIIIINNNSNNNNNNNKAFSPKQVRGQTTRHAHLGGGTERLRRLLLDNNYTSFVPEHMGVPGVQRWNWRNSQLIQAQGWGKPAHTLMTNLDANGCITGVISEHQPSLAVWAHDGYTLTAKSRAGSLRLTYCHIWIFRVWPTARPELPDEVISFPLYVEALKFAFHEDSMIRVAIRTLTLNVYHVGDESVNRFVSRVPLSDYFSDMVKHFQKQCIDLDKLVVRSARNVEPVLMASIEDAIVQIEDALYYFSDVMSSGIPDLGNFITENILQLLVFRIVLPSLQRQRTDLWISVSTSMYLLCCILHIFKDKDMASTVAAALFHQPDCPDRKQGTPNGCTSEHDHGISENQCLPDHPSASDFCQGNTLRYAAALYENYYTNSLISVLIRMDIISLKLSLLGYAIGGVSFEA